MATERLTPADEYVHLSYPRDLTGPWKENYYFNFIDRSAQVWGINHFSISRHTGNATFRAFHVVDGEVHSHVASIPWADGGAVGDEKLEMEIVSPFERQMVRFADGDYSIELAFSPRFSVFDYNAHGPKNAVAESATETFDTEHYEQGVLVSGTAIIGGIERDIRCFGHRDHSWGYRDEAGLQGWNWVAIQFGSATVNLFYLRSREGNLEKGFVSRPDGNEEICSIELLGNRQDTDGLPEYARYRSSTASGRTMTFAATRFSHVRIPLSEAGRVVVIENFSDFVWEETGEHGAGIDEHMVVGI